MQNIEAGQLLLNVSAPRLEFLRLPYYLSNLVLSNTIPWTNLKSEIRIAGDIREPQHLGQSNKKRTQCLPSGFFEKLNKEYLIFKL